MLEGKKIDVGSPEPVRDFLYISDLVSLDEGIQKIIPEYRW